MSLKRVASKFTDAPCQGLPPRALALRRAIVAGEVRGRPWDVLLPIASYVLVAIAVASWALEAPFANMTGALAVVLLLVTALRNSWMVTLAIAGRGR